MDVDEQSLVYFAYLGEVWIRARNTI